jgi:RimJ/RimL family protein N-acetyltransferase
MPLVTVRHFTEADIPTRMRLLREERFQANLTDFAVTTGDDALTLNMRRTIAEEQRTKQIFTLCRPQGPIVGFAWITSIDWRSQCCELSFGVLPEYRGGFGAAAVDAARAHIRTELNMQVIVNQVLEHNAQLVSRVGLAARRSVRCAYDSYTVGQWRTACYWSETEQEERDLVRDNRARRHEVAERIRARSRRTP